MRLTLTPGREITMIGTYLKFYMLEKRRHAHILLYEWLLERAKDLGIHGGSAFRAIAGFGRHGILHEEHFFELAGDLTVEVVFAVADEEADRLLDLVRREGIPLFYIRMPIEYGMVQDTQPLA
jgi:PII-like signaling protein